MCCANWATLTSLTSLRWGKTKLRKSRRLKLLTTLCWSLLRVASCLTTLRVLVASHRKLRGYTSLSFVKRWSTCILIMCAIEIWSLRILCWMRTLTLKWLTLASLPLSKEERIKDISQLSLARNLTWLRRSISAKLTLVNQLICSPLQSFFLLW